MNLSRTIGLKDTAPIWVEWDARRGDMNPEAIVWDTFLFERAHKYSTILVAQSDEMDEARWMNPKATIIAAWDWILPHVFGPDFYTTYKRELERYRTAAAG